MAITVDAIYEGGVLTPSRPLGLPERTRVQVTIAQREEPPTFGGTLRALRQQVVASGEPLLDWDGIQAEVARRRGGFQGSE